MLADLLEKKVDKEPVLNGVIGKELRIGEKGLELVDNHISKLISKENNSTNTETQQIPSQVPPESTQPVQNEEIKTGVKRPAVDDISEIDAKKPALPNSINGSAEAVSPKTDSTDAEDGNVSVSATAANLYASLAADVLEDEDEELLQQEATAAPTVIEEAPVQVQVQSTPMVYVSGQGDSNQGQPLMITPRQIIVSQGRYRKITQLLRSRHIIRHNFL